MCGCIGFADCVAYATERKQFGQAIAQFQLIQGMIADSKTEVMADKALTMETARKRDAGEVRVLAAHVASTVGV